jgi:hypothetical protein
MTGPAQQAESDAEVPGERYEVIAMGGPAHRPGASLRPLGRLLFRRNELRRPADRVEAVVIVTLVAAFLTAAITAACLAGHLYQSQHAAAVGLRPTTAILSQPGPAAAIPMGAARARWRLPDGTQRSGTLTTMTAPAIYNAPARTAVRVWLGRAGNPEAPPPGPVDMIFTALVAGITVTEGAALVLVFCYLLCRMVLDRHRLARWESAWATVGPRWTSRR